MSFQEGFPKIIFLLNYFFRLFENSCRLSGDGIVHFVTALCKVSQEELSLPSGPRLFLLSKIVEVYLCLYSYLEFLSLGCLLQYGKDSIGVVKDMGCDWRASQKCGMQ